MLSNIFSSNKSNSQQNDTGLRTDLEKYLNSCSEFTSVKRSREGVQFNVGNDGRITINIILQGSKYGSHSIRANGGTTTTSCKVKNPSDLKQVMKSVYEHAITFLKLGTNRDKDAVDMLIKGQRDLWKYKL